MTNEIAGISHGVIGGVTELCTFAFCKNVLCATRDTKVYDPGNLTLHLEGLSVPTQIGR